MRTLAMEGRQAGIRSHGKFHSRGYKNRDRRTDERAAARRTDGQIVGNDTAGRKVTTN